MDNNVDISEKSSIIKDINSETEVTDVHYIGKICKEMYNLVAENEIISDDVIITESRIQHIIERRGKDFYNKYSDCFAEIIASPDYIFKDKNKNTAIVSKQFVREQSSINIVLRLIGEGENVNYKNSIITAIGESDKRFAQRLRNNKYVYKKNLDNSE